MSYDAILARSPSIIYRPGGTPSALVVTSWTQVQKFIAARQGSVVVYVDDSIVSPALVPTATGITDCEGRVEIRPYVVDSINFVVLQVEPGATLRNLYRVVSMELRCNAQNATPSLDFPLAPSGGNLILEEFGALTNASTATTTAINVAGGAVLQITGGQANIFLNNPAVPIFNVIALGLLEIVVFDASFIDANYASGGGRVNFVYDNATASSFATPGTPPPLPGITGGYDAVNDDNIWAQKPIDPATFNSPALNAVPVFNGTEWEATTVPSGSVTGTPNTMAYFNASGALTGTPTFVTAIDATGYLIVGATTTDNGSSARLQNTSLVANGSQVRSNQYGNNAGIGGLTAFKSRGAAIGTLAGLLAGDPILRFTSIGVAPDNASIPLASFITVQVPTNFVPAGQNYVPTELELQLVPLAGPINGHRVVFKVSSEGETQTLTGIRAGGPHTLPTNLTTGTLWSSDAVLPNGTIVGSPGDLFSDTTGGAGATLWVKETGVATNTGWVVAGTGAIALVGNVNGPTGANRFLSLVQNVVDADFVVTEVEGWTWVGMQSLTADRTVTLPAAPTAGEVVVVTDATGFLPAHNVIINGNGKTVQGNATYTMSGAQNGTRGGVALQYDGTSWEIFAAFNPGITQQVYTGPLSSAVTQNSQDVVIYVDTSAGAVNLTLPTPVTNVPTRITFRDRAGTFNTNNLTITPPGAVNINGANTPFVVAAQYPHIVAESDGINYFI